MKLTFYNYTSMRYYVNDGLHHFENLMTEPNSSMEVNFFWRNCSKIFRISTVDVGVRSSPQPTWLVTRAVRNLLLVKRCKVKLFLDYCDALLDRNDVGICFIAGLVDIGRQTSQLRCRRPNRLLRR